MNGISLTDAIIDKLKKDHILLIVGESGSGKTTFANDLEEYGFKQVQSYTTRPPRFEGEDGHTFVSLEEFEQLENIVAYTQYNGYFYCSTKEQIDDANIYVIDVAGLKTFIDRYHGEKTPVIVRLHTTEETRRKRMFDRGDSIDMINERIDFDREAFAGLDNYLINTQYTVIKSALQ